MSSAKLTEPSVANLRKASRAVYLACEAFVADDISNLLKWSADEIERLTTTWQPINTAPKDTMFIWAAPNGRGKWSVGLAYRNVSGGWSDAYGGDAPARATLWAPMPTPPAQEQLTTCQRPEKI